MGQKSGFMSLVLFISLLIDFVNAICNYNGLSFQPSYDISIAPSSLENQFVQTKLKFLNIYKIDDGHATMTLILNIYLSWNDSRISITGDRCSTCSLTFGCWLLGHQTMTEAEHNRPIPKLFNIRPSASAAKVFSLLIGH